VTIISVVITYEGSPYYHGFATLEKAIEFAKPGDTVTLIRDVKESKIITIDKAITLDLNGKTADAEFELTGYAASLIASEGLDIKSGIKGHNIIYKNGIYTIDAEHNFGNKWYSDDKEHWQICDCGKTSDKAEHTWDSGKVTKKATCTQAGVTTYTCSNSECGKTKNEPIAAKGHSYSSSYTVDKKATQSANGSKSKHCRNCDAKKSVTVIYKISSVSLSDTHYTYNGETKKPAVTVKNSKGAVLKNGTDYSVSYQSGRKKIGRYKVSVTFKGEYSGNKALYFEIGPKNPSSVKAVLYGKDDVRVSWSKVEGATGYKVYYKRSSASEYTYLTKTTNTSIKKSGLADGVKYNFKVVAYKKADGNNCENAGKTASVYTLRKVKNVKAVKSNSKVKISWTNINGESGYQVSQSTSKSDTNIVATYKTTSGNSVKLKAKKGKTYYYKVRAYKTVDGKRIYAPWSDAVKFKLK
ncbi:MAG: hypothetical protein UHM85_01380, partial [Acutalibacteraceae bacterium]|nr:hypothetical protein [Acutalibacteraceae bacterium]